MKRTTFAAVSMVAILMVAGISAAAPGLKVETDRFVYLAGEDVQISLVNHWHDYIGTGLGYYVTTPQGEIVWMAAWAQIVVMVPPGGSLDYVWDQTYQMSELGEDFGQVDSGFYVIHANYGNSKNCIRVVGEAVEFSTVEQGAISYYGYGTLTEPEYTVIQDGTAWANFWAEHKSGMFPTPETPEVDFSTETVLVAIHGTYPTYGAGIAIDNVCNLGHRTIVNVEIVHTDGMLPVVTNPYHIVTIPHTDQPIVFHETIMEM